MATDVAQTVETKQQAFDLPELADGRFELNLCEVPIVIPFNPPSGLKSYRIEAPETWDQDTGQLITKSLEIFPSVANGFPTRFDAGVLRGLLTIAHRDNGFTERKVYMTRYELAKLLQLPTDGRTSKRLRKSMERLSEVRYRVNNIWWDNKRQQRKTFDNFGVLDRAFIVEGKKGRYKAEEEKESFFVFGDKLFESLQSGYVREIDFNVMNRFKTHVADQTYLLLKKRFHRQHRVSFPLRKYFQFHLGMSSKYNNAQMKNKLKKGILELEDVGLIEPMPYADRFEKKGSEWEIVFHQKKKSGRVRIAKVDQTQTSLFEDDLIVRDMVSRGVTRATAVKLAKEFDEDFIQGKIEILDWKLEHNQSPKRPGGWLRSAIKEDWNAPKDFVPRAKREAEAAAIAKAKAERKAKRDAELKREEEERAKDAAEREERWASVMAYLNSLSKADYDQCIEAAIENLVPMFRNKARANLKDGLDGMYIEMALMDYVPTLIDERAAADA